MKNLALFILTTLLIGCKKDTTTPSTNTPVTKPALIKQIIYSSPSSAPQWGDTIFYFYNNDGRCIRRENGPNTPSDFSYDGNIITEEITYNEMNRTVKLYYMREGTFPDSVVSNDYTFNLHTLKTVSAYEYDSSGVLLRYVHNGYPEDFLREFTFVNGNITQVVRQSLSQPSKAKDITTTIYDLSKVNTIQNPCPSENILYSKNLPVRRENTYGSVKYIDDYQYTFDSLGRVLTRHEVNKDITATYIYY